MRLILPVIPPGTTRARAVPAITTSARSRRGAAQQVVKCVNAMQLHKRSHNGLTDDYVVRVPGESFVSHGGRGLRHGRRQFAQGRDDVGRFKAIAIIGVKESQ